MVPMPARLGLRPTAHATACGEQRRRDAERMQRIVEEEE
jgi:hypothetical protein